MRDTLFGREFSSLLTSACESSDSNAEGHNMSQHWAWRAQHAVPLRTANPVFAETLTRAALSLLTGRRQKLAIEEGELPKLFDNVTTNDLTALAVPSTVNGCA
jgi:hypothetical protein